MVAVAKNNLDLDALQHQTHLGLSLSLIVGQSSVSSAVPGRAGANFMTASEGAFAWVMVACLQRWARLIPLAACTRVVQMCVRIDKASLLPVVWPAANP